MKWKSKILSILTYIDYKYFRTKIGIWSFSALISIAPIVYMGFKELIKKDEFILNLSQILNCMLGSTDLIYFLVTLSTIVLSDVLSNVFIEGKESKVMTYFTV